MHNDFFLLLLYVVTLLISPKPMKHQQEQLKHKRNHIARIVCMRKAADWFTYPCFQQENPSSNTFFGSLISLLGGYDQKKIISVSN